MQILLNTSTVRNNLSFVDSGTVLDVGDGPEQIGAARADQLVATDQATKVAPAEPDAQ